MFTGNLQGLEIGSRNEVYPPGISEGYSGYSYADAVRRKEQQIADMESSSKTVKVIVNIEPIPGRNNEYLVRNTSTYVRGII